MFGELPRGLDRNFVVGHVLPATVLLGFGLLLGAASGVIDTGAVGLFALDHFPAFTAVVAVATLLAATALSALNEGILSLAKGSSLATTRGLLYRLAERRRTKFRTRYDELCKREKELRRRLTRCKKRDRVILEGEIRALAYERARNFPAQPERILPFRFGNTVEAFRVYSYSLYGLDPIVGWPRVRTVVPPDARLFVEDAKAHVDLWVNLAVVSAILGLESIFLVVWSGIWPLLTVTAVASASMFLLSRVANGAARRWGESVMATIDVFLPDLRRKLGGGAGTDRVSDRKYWELRSAEWIYRVPSSGAPRRAPHGARETKPGRRRTRARAEARQDSPAAPRSPDAARKADD